MAKAPKKMANGGPTTSMGNLTSDQIVQQIYANQARRAAAAQAAANAPVPIPGRGSRSDAGPSTAFRNFNDPLGVTSGGPKNVRQVLDPLNVMPGNGRSFVNTAADPLNIFGAGGNKRGTLSRVLDPGGIFGGGEPRHQNIYTTPDGVTHNGGGGVALTPEQKKAQRGLTANYQMGPPKTMPAPAQNTGIVPPAQRIPGYADGGKVINRMPNGKGRGC